MIFLTKLLQVDVTKLSYIYKLTCMMGKRKRNSGISLNVQGPGTGSQGERDPEAKKVRTGRTTRSTNCQQSQNSESGIAQMSPNHDSVEQERSPKAALRGKHGRRTRKAGNVAESSAQSAIAPCTPLALMDLCKTALPDHVERVLDSTEIGKSKHAKSTSCERPGIGEQPTEPSNRSGLLAECAPVASDEPRGDEVPAMMQSDRQPVEENSPIDSNLPLLPNPGLCNLAVPGNPDPAEPAPARGLEVCDSVPTAISGDIRAVDDNLLSVDLPPLSVPLTRSSHQFEAGEVMEEDDTVRSAETFHAFETVEAETVEGVVTGEPAETEAAKSVKTGETVETGKNVEDVETIETVKTSRADGTAEAETVKATGAEAAETVKPAGAEAAETVKPAGPEAAETVKPAGAVAVKTRKEGENINAAETVEPADLAKVVKADESVESAVTVEAVKTVDTVAIRGLQLSTILCQTDPGVTSEAVVGTPLLSGALPEVLVTPSTPTPEAPVHDAPVHAASTSDLATKDGPEEHSTDVLGPVATDTGRSAEMEPCAGDEAPPVTLRPISGCLFDLDPLEDLADATDSQLCNLNDDFWGLGESEETASTAPTHPPQQGTAQSRYHSSAPGHPQVNHSAPRPLGLALSQPVPQPGTQQVTQQVRRLVSRQRAEGHLLVKAVIADMESLNTQLLRIRKDVARVKEALRQSGGLGTVSVPRQ